MQLILNSRSYLSSKQLKNYLFCYSIKHVCANVINISHLQKWRLYQYLICIVLAKEKPVQCYSKYISLNSRSMSQESRG